MGWINYAGRLYFGMIGVPLTILLASIFGMGGAPWYIVLMMGVWMYALCFSIGYLLDTWL